MEINKKELFKKTRVNKGPVNIFIDRAVYSDFKKLCEKEQVTVSSIIERLIVACLKSAA